MLFHWVGFTEGAEPSGEFSAGTVMAPRSSYRSLVDLGQDSPGPRVQIQGPGAGPTVRSRSRSTSRDPGPCIQVQVHRSRYLHPGGPGPGWSRDPGPWIQVDLDQAGSGSQAQAQVHVHAYVNPLVQVLASRWTCENLSWSCQAQCELDSCWLSCGGTRGTLGRLEQERRPVGFIIKSHLMSSTRPPPLNPPTPPLPPDPP